MRGGSTTGRHQRPIGRLAQGAGVRVIIVGVSQDIAYLSGQGGQQLGCDGIVCVLAGVSSAASGLQTGPTDTARNSFQPYHQPCHPDFDNPALVSIDV
jgi:hypothetical protein